MKKQLFLFLTLSFLLVLAACGSSSADSASDRLISMADSMTEVEVTHIISGTMSQWTVGSDTLEPLKNWMLGLNSTLVRFEEGRSPGDEEGGEVYWFDGTDADHPGFSYIINGPDRCYLLIDGTWYSVSNPSNPPVTEP